MDMNNPQQWGPTGGNTDEDDEQSSAAMLGMVYRVTCGLIIVSNLWIILLIIFTRLRRDSFYWKIVMCSAGDIIFGIPFAFQVESFLHPMYAWQYGKVFCQIARYIDATHLVFIAFVLTSLCVNRIIRITTSPGLCVTIVLVLFAVLPIAAAYFAIVPLFAHYKMVQFMSYTSIRQEKFSICKISEHFEDKNVIVVVIVEIIQNTIFLPALFLLIMLLVWLKRQTQGIRDIEVEESDDALSTTDSLSSANLMSSSVAVLVVTIVTILCTVPDSIIFFCSPDCVSDDTENVFSTSIRHYLFLLALVPSFLRPYIWIFDSEVRFEIRNVFCKRCNKGRKNGRKYRGSEDIQLNGR